MYNPDDLKKDLLRVKQEAVGLADELKSVKRSMGLRFLIEAKEGQGLAEVAAAFHKIHPEFIVEPLFPSDAFTPVSESYPSPFPLYETGFVARLGGIEPGDLSHNVFDLVYLAKENGSFINVAPDLPIENPMPDSIGKSGPSGAPVPPDDHAWSLRSMRVKEAWQATNGNRGRGILIGHADTGWTQHVKWEKGGIKPALGWNFWENNPNPMDRFNSCSVCQPGHGTHTASVMTFPGGIGENNTIPENEATGVAPDAINVPIRCVESVILYPFQETVAKAIVYAVQHGFHVISMSLGGIGLGPLLGAVIDHAFKNNRIIVAASGNYPDWVLPGFRFTVEPANWHTTIGVAGSTFSDKPWESSGRVFHGSVDIAAPGENVWMGVAARPGGTNNLFDAGSGTSYATANLAGVAALWLSHHFPNGYSGNVPALLAFRAHIKRTARKPNGWSTWFGEGIVNAEQLMKTRPFAALEDATEVVQSPRFSYAPLASALGAESDEAVASLMGKLLLGEANDAATQMMNDFGLELAFIVVQNPKLRLELCHLLGTVSSADMPELNQVQLDLKTALKAEGSKALNAALNLEGSKVINSALQAN